MTDQIQVPCTIMRGGSSRGPYFLADDLPDDWPTREKIVLAVMGSGDSQQINGVGGGTSLTSKSAIVSKSDHPDADIDYLFMQVSIEEQKIDIGPSCGNILSGAVPFAIESGLVEIKENETLVRVRNLNTDSFIEVTVKTPDGELEYEGDASIDGVPGTGSPIVLNFLDVCGTKTGKLFPTGNERDVYEGIEVSCVDASMPMVLIKAESLNKTGHESKAVLDADEALLSQVERIRLAAAIDMGFGDVTGNVIPKVGLLSKPQFDGTITSRYFVPQNCHASHSVTGAICISVATVHKKTIISDLIETPIGSLTDIRIEHPSGKIDLILKMEKEGSAIDILSVGLIRTAKKIMEGVVTIPKKAIL